MNTMRAVHIPRHGGPEVLDLVEVPKPVPAADQVLVRVLAVSLNHLDLWSRRGMPGVKLPLPLIPGCDGTGELVQLGEQVRGLQVGQRIVIEPGVSSGKSVHDLAGNDHLSDDYQIRGEHFDGLCCEYLCIPARYAFPLPLACDPIQSAAVPLVFLTAWGMLITRARIQAGEQVLVLGGASGVGSAAIQIARDAGCRVIATVGSEAKAELVRALGAHEVVMHSSADWPQQVRKLTGKGADVIVEHVGPATWDGSMRVLARNGRLVTCGGTTGPSVSIQLPHLFIKNQSVLGSTMGPRSAFQPIFDRVARGIYKPVVDRVMPMSAVREAHELLENRQVLGKIVLQPGL